MDNTDIRPYRQVPSHSFCPKLERTNVRAVLSLRNSSHCAADFDLSLFTQFHKRIDIKMRAEYSLAAVFERFAAFVFFANQNGHERRLHDLAARHVRR